MKRGGKSWLLVIIFGNISSIVIEIWSKLGSSILIYWPGMRGLRRGLESLGRPLRSWVRSLLKACLPVVHYVSFSADSCPKKKAGH